ncbi:PREDICTED: vicilin-like antimicrobial peptides 2-2 [Nelumbo nucifera]|uniref:Vicilin-like antimicrobial peptides 2-2 n=1 Tax=Nelumbo nucifera TaxID=4432 RepID=A0A1U7YWY8_NELNU|nr:PREDICTED: vicilin-like antimicrobial peptides 2-2 [Nelumbo nucifera]
MHETCGMKLLGRPLIGSSVDGQLQQSRDLYFIFHIFRLLCDSLIAIAGNYRLAILEVEPNTFLFPHHWDADVVVIVVKGKATINLVRNDNRKSYNLECGDVARIPAGTMVYLVNRDNNENLQIVTLLKAISTLGHVSKFFSANSEDGESFYTAFSNEILEAVLNTPKDKLKRMLGKKRKGVIREASKEQIKAMSEQASSSSEGERWWSIHKSETRGPFNLLKKGPIYSNSYGQLYEAQRFIIPLGHVFTVVASEKENLQIIVFGINAQDNKRNIVGKEHNARKQMDKEAKALVFDMGGVVLCSLSPEAEVAPQTR